MECRAKCHSNDRLPKNISGRCYNFCWGCRWSNIKLGSGFCTERRHRSTRYYGCNRCLQDTPISINSIHLRTIIIFIFCLYLFCTFSSLERGLIFLIKKFNKICIFYFCSNFVALLISKFDFFWKLKSIEFNGITEDLRIFCFDNNSDRFLSNSTENDVRLTRNGSLKSFKS